MKQGLYTELTKSGGKYKPPFLTYTEWKRI